MARDRGGAAGDLAGLDVPDAETSPVATESATPPSRFSEGVVDGLLAGVGFAVLLVALDFAGSDSGSGRSSPRRRPGSGQMAAFLAIVVRGAAVDRLSPAR